MAVGRRPVAHFWGVLVENTITAFEARPANVPEVNVALTSVAAPALVVVNEIADVVPLLQLIVAVPDEEPFPQPRFPLPEADTLPPEIPLTP